MRARFDSSVLAAAKPWLGVVVTNRSQVPVDVRDLRVHLEATRESASFRCSRVVGADKGEREPSVLQPGASFVFDRALDCALPLVGTYSVHVGVSFGSGEWSRPRDVRAFALTVTALPTIAPREVDGLPGLWASVGSSVMQQGASGSGRTLLALVNATRSPIALPPMLLALRVYKLGSPIPCEDKPIALSLPAFLAAGQAHYEPIEVSCLGLTTPGTYDIVAQLLVPRDDGGTLDVSLGRLRVDVVTDPALVNVPVWRR